MARPEKYTTHVKPHLDDIKTCRYSNPSLVQHRDIPSIIDPDKPLRQSTIFSQ